MMRISTGAWILIAAFAPALFAGEPLADAAKRERERREKNKEKGVAARAFGQDDVKAAPRPRPDPQAGEASSSEGETRAAGRKNPPAEKNAFEKREEERRAQRAAEAAQRQCLDEIDGMISMIESELTELTGAAKESWQNALEAARERKRRLESGELTCQP
jgi:hypothetical protein